MSIEAEDFYTITGLERPHLTAEQERKAKNFAKLMLANWAFEHGYWDVLDEMFQAPLEEQTKRGLVRTPHGFLI